MLAIGLAACSGGSGSPTPVSSALTTPAATAHSSSPAPTLTTLPAIPFSGVVPAGTYAWSSFEPKLTLVIPAGWQVGHRARDYFDLFPVTATTGGGPGVGFGRFKAAYGPNGPVPLDTAAAVLDRFAANPAVQLTARAPGMLLGLSGLTAQLRVDAPNTPIFDNAAGAFKLDTGWVVQCWFLDVDDGVLFVGVFGHDGDEAADLAAALPLLDGVSLAR